MKVMGIALMVFEAIVLMLTVPVAVFVEDQSKGTALAWALGLATLCILAIGGLRRDRRTAVVTGSVVQAAVLLAGIQVRAMLVPGVIFGLVWLLTVNLSAKTDAAKRLD